jgi:hypothetical protein
VGIQLLAGINLFSIIHLIINEMTKKYYIVMAKQYNNMLQNAKNEAVKTALVQMIHATANVLQDANSSFDREKFFKACGI